MLLFEANTQISPTLKSKDFLTSPSDLACHIFLYVITSILYISGYLRCFYCLDVSQDSWINHQQSVRSIIFKRDFGGSKFWLTTWNPNSNAVEIFWKIWKISLKKGITTTLQTTRNQNSFKQKVYEQIMSARNHLILFSFKRKHVTSHENSRKTVMPFQGEQRIAADHPGVTSLPASSSTSAGMRVRMKGAPKMSSFGKGEISKVTEQTGEILLDIFE